MSLVALSGQEVPDGSGLTYNLFGDPVVGGAGQIAFAANLSNGGQGLYLSSPWGFKTIAVTGQPAPGTSAAFQVFYDAGMINTGGQQAFAASAGGDNGVWAVDSSGALSLVAIAGQTVAVDGGLRTIASVSMNGATGGQDGMPRTLNEDGQLVVVLQFVDGSSGLFTAYLP